jgi:hypothetical protein
MPNQSILPLLTDSSGILFIVFDRATVLQKEAIFMPKEKNAIGFVILYE